VAYVTITKTLPLYPSSVFLQWEIHSQETGNFYVDIARSGGPAGPWEVLATGLLDAYNFVDNQFGLPPAPPYDKNGREPLNLFSLSRQIYYQVTVTPPSGTANQFASQPTPIAPTLNRVNAGIKRRLQLDLRTIYKNLNGIPLAVMKRRRWGIRCTECWDPVTKEVTREHCPACYGTSFLGGYWAPVQIRGRKDAAAVQTRLEAHGEVDIKLEEFTTLDYPLLEYKDVIVDLHRNDRYEVQRVVPAEINTVVVHQVVTASLLGRNSVEYSFLVDPLSTPSLY
jgi:hypothetical protein